MKNKMVLSFVLSCLTLSSFAGNKQAFSENEDIALELSKYNYNRIFVTNDIIENVHFIKSDMDLEYDPDGSVFINLLSTEPQTLFFRTKQGHTFSATVKASDVLGQTFELIPKSFSVKAHLVEHKSLYEETVTTLIQSMMNNQAPSGFGIKSPFALYKKFSPSLRTKLQKQYIGESYVGEVVTIYNRSSNPIKIEEAWFKNKDTKAVALSQSIIGPKSYETLFIVKEKAHA